MASRPSGSDQAGRAGRRKAKTINSILEAAEQILRADGFHGARIEDIAELAGVAVGSIYFHFESKEGLYLALVERALEVNERYLQDARDPELSAVDQVLAAGEAYLRFHLDHPGSFEMIAFRGSRSAAGEPLEAERRIADRVERFVDGIAALIEQAMKNGELKQGDAWLTSRFVWGAWNGVIELSIRRDRLRLDERTLRAALDLGQRLMLEGAAATGKTE